MGKEGWTPFRLATAEPVVERVSEPRADGSRGDVRSSVNQTNQECVAISCALDTELCREAQICTVRTRLIPTPSKVKR